MLSAVYRNRKWFILSVAVCVLIGFLYLKSSPKIFLRTATVLVKDEQKGGGVNGAAAFQDLFSLGGSTVDNEVGIFKSKRLMRTVVEILHLDISYKEWDGLRKKELYTSTPFAVTFLDATPSQQISLTVTMSDNGKVTLADMTLQNEEEEEEFDEILTVQPGDTVHFCKKESLPLLPLILVTEDLTTAACMSAVMRTDLRFRCFLPSPLPAMLISAGGFIT